VVSAGRKNQKTIARPDREQGFFVKVARFIFEDTDIVSGWCHIFIVVLLREHKPCNDYHPENRH